MVNHTKAFYIKQKEKEIQKKLREEEKRLLKESAYRRKLKKSREYYKKHPEKYKIYYEKCKLKKAKEREEKNKDREEKLIAFLSGRNWRKTKIKGQKGSYYVVDDGHIYNESGKEIGSVNKNGYAVISSVLVHRIIWETFNGEIPEGYEIDHINTVRNDNRIENLRLATHKENSNNPLTIEHFTKYYDIIQMDLENNVIAKYKTTKDIPSKYRRDTICNVINGKSKTSYGYIWKAKIKN